MLLPSGIHYIYLHFVNKKIKLIFFRIFSKKKIKCFIFFYGDSNYVLTDEIPQIKTHASPLFLFFIIILYIIFIFFYFLFFFKTV